MTENSLAIKPSFVILGAGSIGCYVGGCLALSQTQVNLIGRDRIQQQIQEHGLRVTDYKGRDQLVDAKKYSIHTDLQNITPADYILLTVKSADTPSAIKQLMPYLTPSSVIISLQNGVGNTAVIQKLLPTHTVIKAMVPFNVFNQAPGHFHQGTEGDIAIEAQRDAHPALFSVFENANLTMQRYEDLTDVQWGKLILNLNNSVNALSGITLLEQLSNPTYRRVMACVIDEALSVMRIANIQPARMGKVLPKLMPFILRLPNFLFKRVASAMLTIDPQARSSMYEDLLLRRNTEIDYLNGEIVSLALRFNTKAPKNEALVSLIKDAQDKKLGSPGIPADKLLRIIELA